MKNPPPWITQQRPLMVAEIGGNHEGCFDEARRLCDLAIQSGSDYIKFQIYSGDRLVSPVESPHRYHHFQRFELSRAQHLELAACCRNAGVGYCASVWDLESLDWIDPWLDFYKVGSGDLTAWPLLEAMAVRAKPMVISTGLATLAEVEETVDFLRQVNPYYSTKDSILLLQCTAMYPIEDHSANLRVMDTLRQATGLEVGYSDHTRGSLALLAAAARGARLLEYHFTDCRDGKQFRDHQVSLTCSEVKHLRHQLNRIQLMLGDGIKKPMACEVEADHVISFRRALYSRRPLKAGDQIQAEDLIVLRPNHGVDARLYREAVGRCVAKDTGAFEAIELKP